jgi:lipopolysaccharide/colanic/teichoic acid biosynthesis glycosyltransferase
MSLVGPRPPIPSEVKRYQRWQLQRLMIKPGMTGLWQVSGRNRLNFKEWVRLDIRYIRQRSLWLDLLILLRTFRVVFLRPDGV